VPSLRDNIEQILFDPSENLILVGSRSLVSVVSISNREVVARLDTETAAIGRFTQHSDESLLLYVKKEAISVFNWQDLTMEANWPIPEGPESFAVYGHGADAAHENNEPRSTELLYDVVKVFAARVSSRPSSSYMLVATGGPDDRPSLRLIELNWSGVVPTVKIIIIPSGLRGNIRCVLGLHINEAFLVTLVFLDHDGWVCSWAIRDPLYLQEHSPTPDHHTSFQDVDVAYHYCLPGDWTSPESISTMRLTDPGILLCPHNGEIAAVQNLDLINYSI
jgi:hypothetical protein